MSRVGRSNFSTGRELASDITEVYGIPEKRRNPLLRGGLRPAVPVTHPMAGYTRPTRLFGGGSQIRGRLQRQPGTAGQPATFLPHVERLLLHRRKDGSDFLHVEIGRDPGIA